MVVVEYFFTGSVLVAFVIRGDLREPALITIEVDPVRLREELQRVAIDPKSQLDGATKSDLLAACVRPILDWSDADDVVCIVPSGPLFSFPLHAVMAGEQPLIARNPILYAPSASALRYCVHRRTPGAVVQATVFGNPTWDLPHAETEARDVAAILGTNPIIGVDVTREAWFVAMEQSDVIHFAGHARFDGEDALASHLVLMDDTIVTARELFASHRRSIRLMTLSGCQTGVNRIHAGDELLGLTRALLYAGASSLLATLWRIDDAATTSLMTSFYTRWLRSGEMKVDALRNAQLDLVNQGMNPYYWAPFVLIGDWI